MSWDQLVISARGDHEGDREAAEARAEEESDQEPNEPRHGANPPRVRSAPPLRAGPAAA